MAYETGVATSQADFVDKLIQFATANGWTLGEYDVPNKRGAIDRDGIYVQWRWDGTTSIGGYQSLGFQRKAASATVAAGGTGYTVGDTLTLVGGTVTTPATFNVDTVAGGVVTAVSPVAVGDYDVIPDDPVSTTGGTGTLCTLNVVWTSFGTKAPGTQLDDSGNGAQSGVETQRRLSGVGVGPYTTYWFFADASIEPYVHYVLEYSPGLYRHGSFGRLQKFGTWTGGEYHACHVWNGSAAINSNTHSLLLDGLTARTDDGGTIHCEGLPSQVGSGKWGVALNTTTTGTDTAAVARALFTGGFREGFLNNALAGMRANPSSGFIVMVPIHNWYRVGTSGEQFRFGGKMIHVRELNGFFLQPQQEFTIGAETWKAFPMVRKLTTGERSGNMFVAYRKIV